MSANTTYTGYKIGAYLSSGVQIGKFSEIGSPLPSAFGYSNEFSITTDAFGNASKNLQFMLSESTSGSFSVRLKQGNSNLTTISCTTSPSPAISGPTYTVYMPSNVRVGESTAVMLCVDGLAANSTVSNLSIGSYLSGGTQIARFSFDNITWGSSYGYSSAFNVTADSFGHAEKMIYMKVNSASAHGSAYLRVKAGSSNILTRTYIVE